MADIPEEAMVGQDATSTVTARLQQQLQVGGILCLLSCFLLPGSSQERQVKTGLFDPACRAATQPTTQP